MNAIASPAHDADRDYRKSMGLALAHLIRAFPELEEGDRLDIYHDVWLSLLDRHETEGFWPEKVEPWLVKAVETKAKELRRNDVARATEATDPLDGAFTLEADDAMEERVLGELDAENYRSIIDSLSALQRAVAKLRFDWGLSAREIASVLAIKPKHCYAELDKATKVLRPRAGKVKSGEHVRAYEKLLRRHLAGTASEAENAEALHLIGSSSQAKMMAVEMARQARELGALLPAPAMAVEESRARVFEIASTFKQQLADTATSAKQQVASAAARVDPTPLSGTRPGAVATLVAGCVALGGGGAAVCVDRGINPLDAIPGVRTEAQAEKPLEAKAPATPKLPLAPVDVKAPEPEPAKLDGADDAARELAPKVAPSPSPPALRTPARNAAPKPPPAAPGEFDLQSPGTPSGDPGGAVPVQPSVPAPPARGGGGEFGP